MQGSSQCLVQSSHICTVLPKLFERERKTRCLLRAKHRPEGKKRHEASTMCVIG